MKVKRGERQLRPFGTRSDWKEKDMTGTRTLLAGSILAAGFMLTGMTAASADCQADIDKVENAVVHSEREGIDITVAEKMRALLEEANKERRAGNEAKCQELINQAKYIGDVE
ncbi:hypothetical protein SIAM614_16317 [Stappia aggregata IAM 12614]|uniref:Uncharacterized protein n=2 Tax=Roseibium aggregatum TaxID=187304 RepID=A0NWL0_ROSAI|nr:hypothetical protein SIAM614_16317 [Stappia aggregata IAM 12614] [Roseibium aggregatum IAM 12614]